jgi:hypothetical protein
MKTGDREVKYLHPKPRGKPKAFKWQSKQQNKTKTPNP